MDDAPTPGTAVGDAMLRGPKVHPAGLTVGAARRIFGASAKTHMILLVRDGILMGTLTLDDLVRAMPSPNTGPREDGAPALGLGTLAGRTVTPGEPLELTQAEMRRRGIRRLAVTGESGRLLGLLCLKRSGSGFCTDDGVAAMRHARRDAAHGTVSPDISRNSTVRVTEDGGG